MLYFKGQGYATNTMEYELGETGAQFWRNYNQHDWFTNLPPNVRVCVRSGYQWNIHKLANLFMKYSALFLQWANVCFLPYSFPEEAKKQFFLSGQDFSFWLCLWFVTGVIQLQYNMQCHVVLCLSVTCDGRQGSGVCVGQCHIFCIWLSQVGVTAELLFLGQLEGDRDHTKLSSSISTDTKLCY